MKSRSLMVVVLALVVAGLGCGDGDGSGGEVTGDEALRGVMQAIALDFAQVLADAAANNSLATKGIATCPDGGTMNWVESVTGQGTLNLAGCVMNGFEVNGGLTGFVRLFEDGVVGNQLAGPLTVSGGASADLSVQLLTLDAGLPITDATTFWQIQATASDGTPVCAWSGGSGCGPDFF